MFWWKCCTYGDCFSVTLCRARRASYLLDLPEPSDVERLRNMGLTSLEFCPGSYFCVQFLEPTPFADIVAVFGEYQPAARGPGLTSDKPCCYSAGDAFFPRLTVFVQSKTEISIENGKPAGVIVEYAVKLHVSMDIKTENCRASCDG
jgi:hypothetical protein